MSSILVVLNSTMGLAQANSQDQLSSHITTLPATEGRVNAAEKPTKTISTSVSLFSAFGQFQGTSEESESNLEGLGIAGEIRKRDSLWALKGDYFSTQRETKSGNMSISNTYRETRLWALRFFPLDSFFSLYGGGGLGALSVLTKMKVAKDKKTLEGEAEFIAAYILGVRLGISSGLFFDFFRQSSYAPSFPGQNLSSFAFQIGYRF